MGRERITLKLAEEVYRDANIRRPVAWRAVHQAMAQTLPEAFTIGACLYTKGVDAPT